MRSKTFIKYFVFVPVLLTNILTDTFADSLLINTAADIANLVYKYQYVTSLVWWRSNPEYVTQFSKHFNGSLVTAHIQNNNCTTRHMNKVVGYKQTVFLAESAQEFTHFITLVNLDLVIPIRVILVITKPIYDISEITKIAWNNDVADIIIITNDGHDRIALYTYFPYNNEACGDSVPVKLNINTKDFFPKKFTNFYGCPIRATLLHILPYVKLERENGTITSITGIDGSVLMLVVERLNASLDNVSSIEHGGMGTYTNGTGTGSFGDLVNGLADIFVPAGVLTHSRYSASQVSHVYETLDVYWFAPNRHEIYAWAKILLPFFTNTAPFIWLTFGVFVIVIELFKRSQFHKTVTKDSVFFQSFIIFLGQSAKFETKSCIINSMFMIWVWFCLIVRIRYQGDLVDGIQKKILEPHLGSLKEAIKIIDDYGGAEVFREYYSGTSIDNDYKTLYLVDIPLYIKNISEGKGFLLIADILLVQQNRITLQVLDEVVPRSAICIYMRSGWPAAKELDNMILRVIEAGFVDKIRRDTLFMHGSTTRQSTEDSHDRNPLNMSNLSACIYGLIALWMISFIIFIFEFFYHRFKVKRVQIT